MRPHSTLEALNHRIIGLPENSSEGNLQAESLKQFFAKRVTDQVRHLMELWRLANDEHWSVQRLIDLKLVNEKLLKYATRFNETYHTQLAENIDKLLDKNDLHHGTLPSEKLELLAQYLQQLSQAALRKSDTTIPGITPKKPVYILLNDLDNAYKLGRQLQFFGFRAHFFDDAESFIDAMQKRFPAVIVADIDFQTPKGGFELITTVQSTSDNLIPILFFSENDQHVSTRLFATRLGGYALYTRQLDMDRIVEEIENITNITPPEPYRVLVVEDSKSQSYCIENMLNTAGIVTHAINSPLEIFEALANFKPEIILMDMYMPDCNGSELARVIRQEKKFTSIPIVFLSSEDDPDVQITAMINGADDFLTKPIRPKHLRSTIRAKAERARALVSIMKRDSLTGLLNHTSILHELDTEIQKANRNQTPLCFAMIDIDFFKKVNDNYGHPVGDKIIKSLALFLKQRLRRSDFVGRYGGEEFAIVLPNTLLEDALAIFEDIRLRYSQFIQNVGTYEIQSTFSGGIALLDEQQPNNIIVSADQALYRSKKEGRNRISTAQRFTESQTPQTTKMLLTKNAKP